MIKLLILTQYYPPEIGAPQNRLHELAVRLKKKGVNVEVLTAMPNYPKMEIDKRYKSGDIKEEVIDGIQIYRTKIYVSTSKGIISRLLNYFSFVWTSYWRGRSLGVYDFILVESPPLFLGYSAMGLTKILKAKLIFNVSDLWPESAEKMGIVSNKILLKFAYRLEARCYRKATLITGQTMGIVEDIKSRFPKANVHWLPNGVDLEFYNPEKTEAYGFRERNGIHSENVIFFYGGIIGHAQGLHIVLEAAKIVESIKNITVILQGAGPEKEKLLQLKNDLKLENVLFLPPVNKDEMPPILKEVDIALVPLRKLDLFQGAIPSKIFEAMAMKKPLLLGVDGEAKRHFIDKAGAGVYFEPENVTDLAVKMTELAGDEAKRKKMGERGRDYVTIYFDRNNIANDFIEVLNKI